MHERFDVFERLGLRNVLDSSRIEALVISVAQVLQNFVLCF